MKKTITITIDIDLVKELQMESNISGLINNLIKDHFDRKYVAPKNNNEQEIIDKVKEVMQEKAFMDSVKDFLSDWTPDKALEYGEGVRDNKWKGTVEYAKIKVSEQKI